MDHIFAPPRPLAESPSQVSPPNSPGCATVWKRHTSLPVSASNARTSPFGPCGSLSGTIDPQITTFGCVATFPGRGLIAWREIRNGHPTSNFQMETIRARDHSLCGTVVSSVLAVLPGCRGTPGGARSGNGPYHRMALGPALCSRTRPTDAMPSQTDQQVVASRRDIRKSKRDLALLVSGHRFGRRHHRFPVVVPTRCRCSQTAVSQGPA